METTTTMRQLAAAVVNGGDKETTAAGQTNAFTAEHLPEVSHASSSHTQPAETEKDSRVDAIWKQMNKGVSKEKLNSIINKPNSTVKKTSQKTSPQVSSGSWMTYLGLAPEKRKSLQQESPDTRPNHAQNGTSDESKRLAAAALSAVKDATSLAAASGRGKVEITEVRDFAGQEIEVKKYVDADSKEASEKAKASAAPSSAIDNILEQIKKRPKLSVLGKTKQDWVEYKGENKGMEEELEYYKKSGDQYLDKVSFLQRTDYREFERERDARLALQAKRKPDI